MNWEPTMRAITEAALEGLSMTYARHHIMSAGRRPDVLLHGYRDGATDPMVADRAACWLRLVSIVEIHAEALLRELDAGSREKPPNGWADVNKGLRMHGIELANVNGYTQLDACLKVRNAIAHGLGRLTDNQLHLKKNSKPGDLTRELRAIAVPIRDGAVVITPAALAGCLNTCRTFITTLDRQSQQGLGT